MRKCLYIKDVIFDLASSKLQTKGIKQITLLIINQLIINTRSGIPVLVTQCRLYPQSSMPTSPLWPLLLKVGIQYQIVLITHCRDCPLCVSYINKWFTPLLALNKHYTRYRLILTSISNNKSHIYRRSTVCVFGKLTSSLSCTMKDWHCCTGTTKY